MNKNIDKHDVVQFNENHKWCGAFAFVEEVKVLKDNTRYMLGVPMLEHDGVGGTAYIYSMESDNEFDYIGHAALMPKEGT